MGLDEIFYYTYLVRPDLDLSLQLGAFVRGTVSIFAYVFPLWIGSFASTWPV